MQIFLDTETVPSQRPDALALVHQHLKPPAAMKLPATIEKWWATEADAAAAEAHRKQSLDGGNFGEIVSIACTDGDEREWVLCRAPGESEADLLNAFFRTVEQWTHELAAELRLTRHDSASAWPLDDHYLVGHNAQFDLGFLWRRSKVLDVPTPGWLPSPSARVGKDYGCTMQLWAGYGQRISLDTLCTVLGIESPKGDLDGSQVYDAWLAGQADRIARYNLADAKACAAAWHRLQRGAA